MMKSSNPAGTLAAELRTSVRGEVRFDNGSRAMYATDASNYRQVPVGVVIPKDVDDVIKTVAAARRYSTPIFTRGGGTSLAGQCCNAAVVIDMSKYMNQVISIDPRQKLAHVQPGTILDDLRHAAEHFKLTFGPDPTTHARCTLGGMIGNNSCGVHSVMSGKTDDNVEELEILTYDGLRMCAGRTSDEDLERIIQEGGQRGQIYAHLKSLRDRYASLIRERFPNIPRRVSGYNLDQLLPENGFHVARALVGTESTCVTVLEATVRLVYSPPARTLLVLGYPDVYTACDHLMEILAHKPIALEGFDNRLIEGMRKKHLHPENVKLLPGGGGWLLVEFGSETKQEAVDHAHALMEELGKKDHAPAMKLFDNPQQARLIWQVRESGLGASTFVPGEKLKWEGWEDAAVPPDKLGSYLRDLQKLYVKYDYEADLYGHFGQGCVHTRIDFDLETAAGIKKFRSFMEDAADLVVHYGGSLSGEHGDGQARAELLPKMFGPELVEAFQKFKALWDPEWKMNPGKVVLPNKLDADLRLGTEYHPWQPDTHFKFPQDDGSLAQATLRCVGVGKCRQYEGGMMCPSFRATRDEEHSTRGRAHLLWEMTQGDMVRDQWRDSHVKSSLDLCLSCKGCKSDCPVGVDVATYKAEFLSHHYEGKRRPLNHYAFGHIDRWARMASWLPGVANFLTQTPVLRDIAKSLAGVSPQRTIPTVAPSFRSWFAHRKPATPKAPQVVLWPDTFNNYFHPETAIAAVEVLDAAGFEVRLPARNVCCGRPLYDFGMLERAKKVLLRTLEILDCEIAQGIPVVVLEPSCASVFRDELLNLFPNDSRAQNLSTQVFLLGEFLERRAGHLRLPAISRKALVHGHCHQKSVLTTTGEEAVLRRLGVDYEMPAPGCCGMAGAFGFEKEKYPVSLAIGELELLPAVRKAPPDWLIIANGFS